MAQPQLDTSPEVSDEVRQTTCYMCACRCGINVHLKSGKVSYIEGNRAHPVNKGVLCAKGASGIRQVYAPSRLRAPMRRVGPRGSGAFEEISWEDIQRNKIALIFSGGFLGINWILLFEAFRYTTLASATLVYYLAPIIVIIVSAVFFKESLEPLKVVCVGLALAGMVLVSGLWGSDLANGTNLKGILFALGAALFYAAVVLVSQRLDSISAYDGTIVQLAMSAVVLVPYILLTRDFKNLRVGQSSLLSLIIVAVIHTGLAYALYFSALKKLKAQTIALYSYLDPLVAVIASTLILKEQMTLMTLIGGLLILGSTLLSEILDRRKESSV